MSPYGGCVDKGHTVHLPLTFRECSASTLSTNRLLATFPRVASLVSDGCLSSDDFADGAPVLRFILSKQGHYVWAALSLLDSGKLAQIAAVGFLPTHRLPPSLWLRSETLGELLPQGVVEADSTHLECYYFAALVGSITRNRTIRIRADGTPSFEFINRHDVQTYGDTILTYQFPSKRELNVVTSEETEMMNLDQLIEKLESKLSAHADFFALDFSGKISVNALIKDTFLDLTIDVKPDEAVWSYQARSDLVTCAVQVTVAKKKKGRVVLSLANDAFSVESFTEVKEKLPDILSGPKCRELFAEKGEYMRCLKQQGRLTPELREKLSADRSILRAAANRECSVRLISGELVVAGEGK